MTAFRLEIAADNAAFDEPGMASEIARILREAAKRIQAGELPPFRLRDINGNTVGRFGEIEP